MAGTIRRSRTDTFEHTINGLLTKRADLFGEAERIRDRLAEIKNDVQALDRVLGSLGYVGDLDAAMPRQKRDVLFGPGDLSRAILDTLREAPKPMTTREIAKAVLALEGRDAADRRLLSDVVKRVGKALRGISAGFDIRRENSASEGITWSVRARTDEGVAVEF
ncbi:hypothetical protein ACFSCV_15790 [Methylopila henanensis]|uniref:Uncharacterized protein n=1 Tax=Methylopila henanensis TaxID=873516 RepID=A0ABW4KEB4_9HYPH